MYIFCNNETKRDRKEITQSFNPLSELDRYSNDSS